MKYSAVYKIVFGKSTINIVLFQKPNFLHNFRLYV